MAIPQEIRKRILELSFKAGSSGAHLGGALSCVEILTSIYNKIDIGERSEKRDRVILSKGHGALALYCVLEAKGIIGKKTTDTFETNGTYLFAHATRNVTNGIEFSGGSLGLGISFATGVAIACKSNHIDNRIYVIVGDGECDEGIFWESLSAINKYKLDNITIIIDKNGFQADGPTEDVLNMSPMIDKLRAFGMEAVEVNGHSEPDLAAAFDLSHNGKALAIVAKTVKGKGVSFMENNASWHHGVVNQKKYNLAIEELNQD